MGYVNYLHFLYMDEYIRNLGNSILDTKSLEDLDRLLYKMETKPFCGLERCYDLEHFVFHIIQPFQRDAVIEHIRSLSADALPKPHIFTDLEYIQSLKLLNVYLCIYLTLLLLLPCN